MNSKTTRIWTTLRYLAVIPLIVLGILSIVGKGGGGGGGVGGPSPLSGDPLVADQWHLKNTGQAGGTAGEDVNVEPVWTNFKGTGVRIAVVDDGLEIGHEDLQANVVPGESHNYLDGSTDPSTGDHGTSVAGVAAAVGFNGLGLHGAAPSAGLVGYNLLQNLTDANQGDAMTRGSPANHIYSNSWGAPDDRGTLDASVTLWTSAINDGLVNGRNGLGAIYTWAAGNGAPRDNSNYDGQANYRGVMAIAAVTDRGTQASYSENGANLWVGAGAGEFCDTHTLSTTDRTGALGFNDGSAPDYTDPNYTKCFNGTSGATPVVSGVIALILEANPNLGWRDVRRILAQTARQNDAGDTGWVTNGGGFTVNHKYGFGVPDADAAVTAAGTWTNVGPQSNFTVSSGLVNILIPDGSGTNEITPVFGAPVADAIFVSASGITDIEFIEVTFTSDHTFSGDLEIVLTNPSGITSRLAEPHFCFDSIGNPLNCGSGFAAPGWRFGSARHLGEAAGGTWALQVRDGFAVDTGFFQSWSIRFYGT